MYNRLEEEGYKVPNQIEARAVQIPIAPVI